MPLVNKLPQVSDGPFQGCDVSGFNLNDVGLQAHSSPLFSDCFKLCLSSKRSLSRQEQTCLMDCYKKNPTHRPFTLLLWPTPLIPLLLLSLHHPHSTSHSSAQKREENNIVTGFLPPKRRPSVGKDQPSFIGCFSFLSTGQRYLFPSFKNISNSL